jgi:uncharacterized protein (TIGR00661 family)
MFSPKRILICPLDWGLGHATRCIPIIRLLLKKKAEVIIAADCRPLELLKKEFPELTFIKLTGYSINYPNSGSMILKMLFLLPKIFKGIYTEHKELKKIIKEKKIDIVISDSRFGLWNNNVKSIFITHQLMIKTPFAEKLLHLINLYFIKKYDECWIPDDAGAINLSSDLAHKYPLPKNTFFIGLLSRFNAQNTPLITDNVKIKNQYDVMAIISGPEPQRSIFEKLITTQFQQSNLKTLIVCGKSELEPKIELHDNTEIIDHLNADEMQQAIINSKIIIARSGYSTIMDLAVLGKKALFVPTPGQTEQEYLAQIFLEKKIAYTMNQEKFNLTEGLKQSENFTGFEIIKTSNQLEERINTLFH